MKLIRYVKDLDPNKPVTDLPRQGNLVRHLLEFSRELDSVGPQKRKELTDVLQSEEAAVDHRGRPLIIEDGELEPAAENSLQGESGSKKQRR